MQIVKLPAIHHASSLVSSLAARSPSAHQREIPSRGIAYAKAIETIETWHFTDGYLIDIAPLGISPRYGILKKTE
jgi:hypothetical protein